MSAGDGTPSTPTRGTPSRRGHGRSPGEAAGPSSKPASFAAASAPVIRTADEFVRPFSTLTSALDVPTDGSLPPYDFRNPPREIDLEDREEPVPKPQSSSAATTNSNAPGGSQQPGAQPKRAPRKSKTDAMAAIARGDSPGAAEAKAIARAAIDGHGGDDGVPKIERAPRLNWGLVKSESPRVLPPRTTPRAFGLEDCPTFYPSLEEFKDPIKYLQAISPKAKEYGICKIVPPVGWRMPFYTDTEVRRSPRDNTQGTCMADFTSCHSRPSDSLLACNG